ncbi:MAG TPA: hypothetical protein VF706_04730, partial [Solirubrobacteraceae bacterium]
MAELVWKGKGSSPRRTAAAPRLTTDEIHGDGRDACDAASAWRNRLVAGDAAEALRALRPELAGKVSLVY